MAQRVNPIIFRLGVTKLWDFKHFQKKASDQAVLDFTNLEFKKFTLKFFKDRSFDAQECKINYSNNGYLNIFLSCYKIPQKDFIETKIINITENFKDKNRLAKEDYFNYRLLDYTHKLFNKNYSNQEVAILKKTIINKNYNNLISSQTINKNKISLFLNDFIESISKFSREKITVFLTFQILTKTIKNNLNKKTIEFIQKKITKLNKYKENNFFKEGLNTLYICSKQQNSADLLAEFIAIQLKKNKKKYNKFFLNFIKKCLNSFKKENPLKTNNIKIQIKGRLSRGARAKKMVFRIANKLPILTIKNNIDYSEKVAYTPNGTIGVKVWIHNQIN